MACDIFCLMFIARNEKLNVVKAVYGVFVHRHFNYLAQLSLVVAVEIENFRSYDAHHIVLYQWLDKQLQKNACAMTANTKIKAKTNK